MGLHPSLWRQSTLVAKQELYEVVPGIYQARGFDFMTGLEVLGDPTALRALLGALDGPDPNFNIVTP